MIRSKNRIALYSINWREKCGSHSEAPAHFVFETTKDFKKVARDGELAESRSKQRSGKI